jgi:DNA-binding response OmpR family regulator
MAKILVVEDDIDIAQGLAEFLGSKGYILDFAYTGKQAMFLLESESYHLVLLDINLPFVSGIEICQSLLQSNNGLARLPVIIMSAKISEADILVGFKSGAWDYLTKPFSFSELAARIEVSLKKTSSIPSESNITSYQNITLNYDSMLLSFGGACLQLHQVGFDIFKMLLKKAPDVVKTSHLHQKLWDGETPESNPLRAHIYNLRKQLRGRFGQPLIVTVKGVGYKIDIKQQQAEFLNEQL